MRGFRRILNEGYFFSYFRRRNRWIVLLFCIFIAFFLWVSYTLDGTFTKEISISVDAPELPANFDYVTKEELPSKVTLSITSSGRLLMQYSLQTLFAKEPKVQLHIDSTQLQVNGGHMVISEPELMSQFLYEMPNTKSFIEGNTSTVTTAIQPSSIAFDYEPLTVRTMPVAFTSQVNFSSKNLLLKSFQMTPDLVRIYGKRDLVDSLQLNQAVLQTDTIPILIGSAGTSQHKLALLVPDGVKIRPDSISVDLVVDLLVYDEKVINNIAIENLPEGYRLRLFPPSIKVTYLIPSDSTSVDESIQNQIRLYVDANDIFNDSKKTLPVKIWNYPEQIYMMQLEPGQVEFIIEEVKNPE